FVCQKLVPLLWKGACLVMENCSIHKGSRIGSLIEQVGAKLIRATTSSADFNQARKLLAMIFVTGLLIVVIVLY
ncbi:MAG: hypothetical protein WBA77_00915, partial [Microcoleaceae cyanobacterium]